MNIGVILAIFRIFGNVPDSINAIRKLDICPEIRGAHLLRIVTEMSPALHNDN